MRDRPDLQWRFVDPDLVRARSIGEIVSPITKLILAEPGADGVDIRRGTLCDPRSGPRREREVCENPACGASFHDCDGHAGHIELFVPLFVAHYLRPAITRALSSLCSSCHLLSCECGKPRLKATWCVAASAKRAAKGLYVENERWTAARARTALLRVSKEEWLSEGWSDTPANAIATCIPVLSVVHRPWSYSASRNWSANPLTHAYADLIKANLRAMRAYAARPDVAPILADLVADDGLPFIDSVARLRCARSRNLALPPPEYDAVVAEIQTRLDLLFSPPRTASSKKHTKQIAGVLGIIKGKPGHLRNGLLGKTTTGVSRSVISNDSHIPIDYVGVPHSVATTLSMTENVNSLNLEQCRRLVKEGKATHVSISGVEFDVAGVDSSRLSEFASQLIPNDSSIHRHLQTGDYVVFNRQPTLHRGGMMAHRAFIVPEDDSVRAPMRTTGMNVCATGPYNADFDGDEMTIHAPPDLKSRAELEELVSVSKNFIDAGGSPMFGFVQNALVAAHLMTRRDAFVSREEAMNLAFRELPPPACFRIRRRWDDRIEINALWTPKQLLRIPVAGEFSYGGAPLEYDTVLIRNGEIVSAGALTKKHIGVAKGSIFHRAALADRERCMAWFSEFQDMTTEWIQRRGFSMSLSDFHSTDSAKAESSVRDDGDWRDFDAVRDALKMSLRSAFSKDAANGMMIMETSGAKGGPLNMVQMVAMVGMQTLLGLPCPRTLNGRFAPAFAPGETTPAALGFVARGYLQGLRSTEMFAHLTSIRDSVAKKQLSTRESGYMMRKLVLVLQNLRVEYDWTVRTEDGRIVQFRFGGDGVDPSRIAKFAPAPIWPAPPQVRESQVGAIEKAAKRIGGIVGDSMMRWLAGAPRHPEAPEIDLESFIDATERIRIAPCDAIGIITAQCIGEPATQAMLDAFHNAADGTPVRRRPRLAELIYARMSDCEAPTIIVPRTAEYALLNCRAELSHTVHSALPSEKPAWMQRWIDIFGEPSAAQWLEIALRPGCVASMWDAVIAWFPDREVVHTHETDSEWFVWIALSPKEHLGDVLAKFDCGTAERCVLRTETECELVVREPDALIRAMQAGSPTAKTTDLGTALRTFGIDACRDVFYHEFILATQDKCSIDSRYISLLSDALTREGRFEAVSRKGAGRHSSSPLSQGAFEFAVESFVGGVVRGAIEPRADVSSCLVTGRNVPLGTGSQAFELRIDDDALQRCRSPPPITAGDAVDGNCMQVERPWFGANVKSIVDDDDDAVEETREQRFNPLSYISVGAKRKREYDPDEEYAPATPVATPPPTLYDPDEEYRPATPASPAYDPDSEVYVPYEE